MLSRAQHHLISGSAFGAVTLIAHSGGCRPKVVGILLHCGGRPGRIVDHATALACGSGPAGGAAGPLLCFEDGALWHGSGVQEAPEGDDELARQGNDHDAFEAAGRDTDAVVEPSGERAVGLPMQP